MQEENFNKKPGEEETNLAVISGVITREPERAYVSGGKEPFCVYDMDVSVRRKSDKEDVIRVKFPDYVAKPESLPPGAAVEISGPFYSRNVMDSSGKRWVELFVYAHKIELTTFQEYQNTVFLDGFVCRKPTYKVSMKGRKVTEILLAVNTPSGRSDYIPCVCWGENAELARDYEVGSELEFEGRIESRQYMKNGKTRTAYEVSVKHIGVVFLPPK